MYDPVLGRWIQQDPIGYGDGNSLYEYVRGSPLAALDPAGTQTTAPTTRPVEFQEENGYLFANSEFGPEWLGQMTVPSPTLTLPSALEDAIQLSATNTRTKGGYEWGGVVTVGVSEGFRVWQPVTSRDSTFVNVASSQPVMAPRGQQRTTIGFYHIHPDKYTALSRGDIRDVFLSSNSRYTFAVMANCNADKIWVVVALKDMRKNQSFTYPGWTGGPQQQMSEAAQREYELYSQNLLALAGKTVGFALYRRDGTEGPLKLVEHQRTMQPPRSR